MPANHPQLVPFEVLFNILKTRLEAKLSIQKLTPTKSVEPIEYLAECQQSIFPILQDYGTDLLLYVSKL